MSAFDDIAEQVHPDSLLAQPDKAPSTLAGSPPISQTIQPSCAVDLSPPDIRLDVVLAYQTRDHRLADEVLGKGELHPYVDQERFRYSGSRLGPPGSSAAFRLPDLNPSRSKVT